MSRLTPVAAYTRGSHACGVAEQRQQPKKYAEQNGLQIIEWYEDDSGTGIDDGQRNLTRLLDNCVGGNWKMVLCKDLARLRLRRRLDSVAVWQKLSDSGVKLRTVVEGEFEQKYPSQLIISLLKEEVSLTQSELHGQRVRMGKQMARNRTESSS